MKNVITSRLELLLAKIAGRDVDISTMTPPVAINLKEELLLDIADRLDSASSELPKVSAADDGDVLKVVSGKWAKGEESKELPAVSSTDNGDVLTVVEGAWAKSAPSGGGSLVVETEWAELGQYEVGYKTIMDADDIVSAIEDGQTVYIHTSYHGGISGAVECYLLITGYQPPDADNDISEGLSLYIDYNNCSFSYSGFVRTQDGKFLFRVYID